MNRGRFGIDLLASPLGVVLWSAILLVIIYYICICFICITQKLENRNEEKSDAGFWNKTRSH